MIGQGSGVFLLNVGMTIFFLISARVFFPSFIPKAVPRVWSTDGPVCQLEVAPAFLNQSNWSSVCVLSYVHNPLSKSQSPEEWKKKVPRVKKIDVESRCYWARVAKWWEHSPPTNVAWVRIPASTPYVGWVCCWFSSMLREVLLRVLRSGKHGHVSKNS